MTLDELINRLEVLREELGGDAPFCIKKDSTLDGRVTVFEPAVVEVYNVVHVNSSDSDQHWVCLMNGNNSQIVAAF